MLDRLTLTDARIDGLAAALENLANLPDPVGNVVRGQTLPNGLRLRQINVPMGVVAAIYEARPNVTVDIAGLALKSGNAVILRGGTAAAATNAALVTDPPRRPGIGGPARRRRPDRGPVRPRRRQRPDAGPRPGGRADSPRRPRTDPVRRDELLRAGHRDR